MFLARYKNDVILYHCLKNLYCGPTYHNNLWRLLKLLLTRFVYRMDFHYEDILENDLFSFVTKFTTYNAMLFIRDLHRITKWRGIWFHKFLPVKHFTVIGTVINVCRRDKVVHLEVDDGTASIPCIFFLEDCDRESMNEHRFTEDFEQKKCLMSMVEMIETHSARGCAKEIELGSLVHLRGDLEHSNGQTEFICRTIEELDANDEALYKFLRLELYKRIYDVKIDWYQLFLDFLKGNPGIWMVQFLRKRKQPCFMKQDLLDLKSQVLEEHLIDLALEDMRHAGFIYERERNMFQIVEFDEELQEFVLKYLQDDSEKSGTSAESIYAHLNPKFLGVALEHINLCLKVLEFRGDVYATGGEGCFRAV